MPEQNRKSWLRHQHPEYSVNADRLVFARDAYTGEVLESDRVSSYLVMKSQGETQEAYKERCQLADYTNHFATLVDELAGMIFAVEGQANRVFLDEEDNGLGATDDLDTPIGRLYQDADGHGNGWLTVWKQAAVELIHSRKIWVVADATDETPLVRIFPASAVPNWRYEDGTLVQVVLKETTDVRTDITQEPVQEERFVVYGTKGWQRYKIAKDDQGGESEVLLEEGAYTRGFEAPDGTPALPIFPVELPMRRFVGWLMAKKAISMFNLESIRDYGVWKAGFSKLVLPGDDDYYTRMVEELKKGSTVLQGYMSEQGSGNPTFIAPDSGPATATSEVLKRKVEEFYITGFREYGDAAREKTATEVRHDVAQGVGAFLQMLAAALDTGENGVLWRIEQIEFDDRAKWFISRVERSEDFAVSDPQELATKLAERYLGTGTPAPIGEEGVLSMVRQLAAYDGLTLDEGQVRASVRLHELKKTLQAIAGLPIPAEARAEMSVTVLAALNYFDPKEMVKLEDGTERLKMDLMRERALMLAEAQDERERDFLSGMGAFPGVGG